MSNMKVMYIVGDEYPLLSKLARVMTMRQFMIAVLEKNLPEHRLWIVGQGITPNELQFLKLCDTHLKGIHLYFGAQASLKLSRDLCAESSVESYKVSDSSQHNNFLEWSDFHFIDATRVQADLKILHASEPRFLAQDFLFTAAKELTEQACQSALPEGVLIIKQASFSSFHRLFPLAIKVETQFQLMNDNKRSIKSLTRFYQDYTCTAEVSLSFDLYAKEDAEDFYQELAEKTVEHLSEKMEEE